MNKLFLGIYLFLITAVAYGQDSLIGHKPNRLQICIKAGASYKFFFGKRYIEPTTYGPSSRTFTDHQYERFTKTPSFGFQGGALFMVRLFGNWSVSTGVLFCTRKDIFKTSQDTVIRYGNGSDIHDIHNVLEYDYSYHNFEVPLLLSFDLKRFCFYGGVNFQLLTYYKATYTYLLTQGNYYPYPVSWETSQKTLRDVEWICTVVPTLQVSYAIYIKKFVMKPYLGIDFSTLNSFYLHGGVIFPLFSFGDISKAEVL